MHPRLAVSSRSEVNRPGCDPNRHYGNVEFTHIGRQARKHQARPPPDAHGAPRVVSIQPTTTRELVVASLTWDSWILVNEVRHRGKPTRVLFRFTGGPVRFETWRVSLGNISKADFGPTYGSSLMRIALVR